MPEPCDNVDHLKARASRATQTDVIAWKPTKPLHGYTIAVRHESGAKAMTGRSDMGTHLIVSGSALAAFATDGQPGPELVAHMASLNARFTRLDLALDVINSRLNFLQAFRDIDEDRAETQSRAYLLVQSNDKGWTLYVGSRSSDRFFRVYNKYAEVRRKAQVPPDCEDWVRFELSLSRVWARIGASLVERHTVPLVVPSAIKAFIHLPNNRRWAACLSGATIRIGHSTTRGHDTQFWLLESVTKTLAREIVNDPDFAEKFRVRTNERVAEEAARRSLPITKPTNVA